MSISKESKVMFILYVANQERSREFYRELLGLEPALDVPGMTEFELPGNAVLGIMPEEGIVRVLEGRIPHPQKAGGIPRSELYLFVDRPDEYYDKLVKAGGTGISMTACRSWGDEVSYGSDPDGHIVAFARKGC